MPPKRGKKATATAEQQLLSVLLEKDVNMTRVEELLGVESIPFNAAVQRFTPDGSALESIEAMVESSADENDPRRNLIRFLGCQPVSTPLRLFLVVVARNEPHLITTFMNLLDTESSGKAEKLDIHVKDAVTGNTAALIALKHRNIDLMRKLIETGADIHAANRQGETLLSIAIELRMGELASELLQKGAKFDFSKENPAKRTCLFEAVFLQKKEDVEFFLHLGVPISQKNSFGDCVLHQCVRAESHADPSFVEFLIEKGADVNCRNIAGENCLELAVYHGSWDLVKIFHSKGSDIDAIDPITKRTLLMKYAFEENEDVVSKLLELGSSVEKVDIVGNSVLFYSSSKKVFEMCLEKSPLLLEMQNANGECILHKACRNNESWVLNAIFGSEKKKPRSDEHDEDGSEGYSGRDASADGDGDGDGNECEYEEALTQIDQDVAKRLVNVRSSVGMTPLMECCRLGFTRIASRLISLGARVNMKSSMGEVALQLALWNNHWEVGEVLIDMGRSITNLSDPIFGTILHRAIHFQWRKIVELIVRAGPRQTEERLKMAMRGKGGDDDSVVQTPAAPSTLKKGKVATNTPRGAATETVVEESEEEKEIKAEREMDCAADLNAFDSKGRTPVMLAIERNDAECIQTLFKVGGALCDRQCVVTDMEAGLVNANMLHVCAFWNHVDALNVVLDDDHERCVDMEEVDGSGNTPLLVSAIRGSVEVASILIEHGANVHFRRSSDGKDALEFAIGMDNSELCGVLVRSGCDVNELHGNTQGNGKSHGTYPLHQAMLCGAASCVGVLIEAGASLDAVDEDGRTPILAAIQGKHPECARLLLSIDGENADRSPERNQSGD